MMHIGTIRFLKGFGFYKYHKYMRSFTNFKIVYSKHLLLYTMPSFNPEKKRTENEHVKTIVFWFVILRIKMLQRN